VSGASGDGGAAIPDTAKAGAAGLRDALGVPLGAELLERALTHRSFAYENGGLPTNERLEFLGDSVLGLIVTDTLFREYPDLPEGQLAKLRAAVVNMRALAGVARGLQLGSYVRLGKGEEGTGGRDKSSILADTLEAVIGAVYLDKGLPAADALVHRLFDPVIARSARLGAAADLRAASRRFAWLWAAAARVRRSARLRAAAARVRRSARLRAAAARVRRSGRLRAAPARVRPAGLSPSSARVRSARLRPA